MPDSVPTVLILGHSFVRRMQDDLSSRFHPRTDPNFNLSDATVCFHGVGGRTVRKLRTYDLHVVRRLKPDVIILELGTNDLTNLSPEVVGSEIEELVSLLLETFSVRVICVCHVIPRGISFRMRPIPSAHLLAETVSFGRLSLSSSFLLDSLFLLQPL